MFKRILAIVIGMGMVIAYAGIGMGEPLTPQMCKQKVNEAAKLIEEKGAAVFPEMRDPKGKFIFGNGEGYVWVHNLDGVMLMHPIKASLEGKGLLDMRDVNGNYFFVTFNEVAEKHGAGWIPYLWPKPGEKDVSPKVSYVKLVKQGGVEYVVGSGMYDVKAEDIKKLFPGDVIQER